MRERGWSNERFSERGYGREGDGGREYPHEAEMEHAPIVKVIEVLAESPHGWEDAANRALVEASRTVHNIRSLYIQEMQAVVRDDRIVAFRVNAKISFGVDTRERRSSGYGGGQRRWD
jgi:hypothetical protein